MSAISNRDIENNFRLRRPFAVNKKKLLGFISVLESDAMPRKQRKFLFDIVLTLSMKERAR